MNNNINGTPPKSGSFRAPKTHSATGVYQPGTMRTGRTTENGDLNVTAASGRVYQKRDPSPQLQRRTPGMKTRSPSPAHRASPGNGVLRQQQKIGTPPTSSGVAKHCHECGEPFPVDWAKFCCECGEKRLGL